MGCTENVPKLRFSKNNFCGCLLGVPYFCGCLLGVPYLETSGAATRRQIWHAVLNLFGKLTEQKNGAKSVVSR